MKGNLSVSSVLGEGTTFTLDLPLKVLNSADAASTTLETVRLQGSRRMRQRARGAARTAGVRCVRCWLWRRRVYHH